MGNRGLCGCSPEQGAQEKEDELGGFRALADRLDVLAPDVQPGALADRVITAEEQRLFMRVIDKLEEHDEFMSSDAGSEAGDTASTGMHVNYGNDAELQKADKLEDPKIEDWELVNAWHRLRHHQLPDRPVAERILKRVTRLHAALPNVIKVDRPGPGQNLIVVGDLHGHLGDLMHILDEHGEPKEGAGGTAYIFNGDFVDRGIWGPEVLLCLYCLKLRFPSAVHLNRGNHEDLKMNAQQGNGFRDVHCSRAWKRDAPQMYELCRRSFLCLPLVHVVGDELCVLHGGLPLDPDVTLAEIDRINRKRDVPMPSCSNLGYPSRQKVTARRPLVTRQSRRVPQGSVGEITGKVKKTRTAEVTFEEGQVLVNIAGAPELEQELNIVYTNDRTRELQRLDRIFISLLWSDPVEIAGEKPEDAGPNTTRGMGTRFDAQVTDSFLTGNGLSCLIRSHQKHGNGYETEYSRGTAPMAVTVFSASNYPGGAGEHLQEGNLASVAVFKGDEAADGQPLVQVMKPSKAWSEPHHDLARWRSPVLGDESLKNVSPATPTSSSQDQGSTSKKARAQALEQLWLRIYCSRPELLAFFSNLDQDDQGTVTLAQWASAMRGCLVPDEKFPWEELAPHLASFHDGKCHYMAFLMRYRNVLCTRLESHWCRRALGQLFGKMGMENEADRNWKELDRNADGELSYFELRPLLKANLEFASSDIESDGVYTLLAALDKNSSGFVEKSEFIEAIGRGREWYQNANRTKRLTTRDETEAIDQCWGFLHSAMRTLASKHTSVSTLFRFLDTSRDGVLSRDEFMSGLKVLLNGDKQLTDSMSNWEPLLWTLIDRDGSGTVSLEELASALYVVDSLH